MLVMELLAKILFVLLLFYVVIVSAVWQWRNPLANSTTFFTHFTAAMSFQALPQFQERP